MASHHQPSDGRKVWWPVLLVPTPFIPPPADSPVWPSSFNCSCRSTGAIWPRALLPMPSGSEMTLRSFKLWRRGSGSKLCVQIVLLHCPPLSFTTSSTVIHFVIDIHTRLSYQRCWPLLNSIFPPPLLLLPQLPFPLPQLPPHSIISHTHTLLPQLTSTQGARPLHQSYYFYEELYQAPSGRTGPVLAAHAAAHLLLTHYDEAKADVQEGGEEVDVLAVGASLGLDGYAK